MLQLIIARGRSDCDGARIGFSSTKYPPKDLTRSPHGLKINPITLLRSRRFLNLTIPADQRSRQRARARVRWCYAIVLGFLVGGSIAMNGSARRGRQQARTHRTTMSSHVELLEGARCSRPSPSPIMPTPAPARCVRRSSIRTPTRARTRSTLISRSDRSARPRSPRSTAGRRGSLQVRTETCGSRKALANHVSRMTPSGTITEFLVSDTGQRSCGDHGGAGRKPVVYGNAGDTIGRITPTGTITEFPLFTEDSIPEGITAGPDGNLWFTVNGFNSAIGRITPAGVITTFPLTTDSGPQGITAGPDGNLWFTEETGNAIGRITPAGTVTEFPVPTPNSRLRGNYDRPRWQSLVHGILGQPDRHDQPDDARDCRVSDPDGRQRSHRHHGRARTATSGSRNTRATRSA